MTVTTIPQLFYASVKERPRADLFSSKDAEGVYRDVSSAETQRLVRAIRLGLDSLGVGRGDRVAILSENRLEWALADLAALSLGAVDVPIYPTLLPDTIEFILKDCAPVAVFVSNAEQAAKIAAIRGRLPFLREMISFDHVQFPDVLHLDKLIKIGHNLADKHPQNPADDVGPADRDDPCSIIYTSGTTGNPKGVVLTHWNFVSNVLTIASIIPLGPDDKMLSFLPLSHVFERMAGYYTPLHIGIGIAYAESVETVAADMGLVRPTLMVSVPRLYEKIYDRVTTTAMSGSPVKRAIFQWARKVGQEWGEKKRAGAKIPGGLALQYRIVDKLVFAKLRARTGGRLRFFVSGGAPLATHINEFFYAAGMMILEGYGLTETSPVVSCNSFEDFRIGSVGKVIPDTEVKIAPDGEIVVRGPQVMSGYYNNEEATREVLTEDGWFHTGDIGHFDDDGFLYITDRKKDLIVTSGGKNIAPQPMENAFKKNKFISQIVVLGDRHAYLVCLIVPNFENLEAWASERKLSWTDRDDLLRNPEITAKYQRGLDRTNRKFPSFSTVKKFTLLKEEFTLESGELTPTLKVKRRAIQERYGELIESLYTEES
ncbi:long-chain fatty acid--CoA ligase [bacterium]|nr:long-chain fatty acid--CoA ligase [bacterium]MBU1674208.1 long-chain fatty acid--CoA ligase [bacterium]